MSLATGDPRPPDLGPAARSPRTAQFIDDFNGVAAHQRAPGLFVERIEADRLLGVLDRIPEGSIVFEEIDKTRRVRGTMVFAFERC